MFGKVVLLFACAFFLCDFLIPILEKFAKAKGFVTCPYPKKIDCRSVPYLGGMGIFSVVLLLGIVFSRISFFVLDLNQFNRFLLASCVIVFLGLYDDIKELNPVQKLVGQFIGALILIGFGLRTQIVFLNPLWNIITSFLWIMLLVNAFNLLDILDGLAGGVSLINSIAFFLFALLTQNDFVLIISVIQFGCLLAFLRYNLPPAQIFMGDAGSQFLGFSQAVMAISLSFAPTGRAIGLTIPLVILALPLFDMLFVIVMRLCQNKSIFLKSNDHFVFRLLKIGFSRKKILGIMIILAVITNCCALIIFLGSNIVGTFAFLVVIGIMCFIGVKLSRLEINE